MNELPDVPQTSDQNSRFNPLILFTLVLLLPACCVCFGTLFLPSLDTLDMSSREIQMIADSAEYVGTENYDRLVEDERFQEAAEFSARLTVGRVAVAVVLPLLVGGLIGVQGWLLRGCNRIFLAAAMVGAAPVSMALIWSRFWARSWDFETFDDSPLFPPPESLELFSREGAANNVMLFDTLLFAALAVAVGGVIFAAVVRGRQLEGGAPILAGGAAWLIGVLVALMVLPQNFSVPFVLTNGGPANSTTTISLYIYNLGFRFLDLGYASAVSIVMIVGTLVLAFVIWLVMTGANLRLRMVGYGETWGTGSVASCLSMPLILVVGLPMFGLGLWGVWLVLSNGGFTEAFESIEWFRKGLYTVFPSWVIIWIVQIPLAYLVGLVLGFWRPLGRIGSSLLFMPFMVFAFIPVEGIMFSWFQSARDAELLDQLEMVRSLPYLIGAFSLIAFKLFFDGAHDAYHEGLADGQSSNEAFAKRVFVPSIGMVLVVGAVLSFLSMQELLWSMVVTRSTEDYTIPLEMSLIRGSLGQEEPLASGAFVWSWLISAVPFFLIFLILHIVVLDRLALVSGGAAGAGVLDTRREDEALPSEAQEPWEVIVQEDDDDDDLTIEPDVDDTGPNMDDTGPDIDDTESDIGDAGSDIDDDD